jgi:hypothetical protein
MVHRVASFQTPKKLLAGEDFGDFVSRWSTVLSDEHSNTSNGLITSHCWSTLPCIILHPFPTPHTLKHSIIWLSQPPEGRKGKTSIKPEWDLRISSSSFFSVFWFLYQVTQYYAGVYTAEIICTMYRRMRYSKMTARNESGGMWQEVATTYAKAISTACRDK